MLNILKPNTIESAVKSLVKAADNPRRIAADHQRIAETEEAEAQAARIRAAESLQYAEQAGKISANLNQLIGR